MPGSGFGQVFNRGQSGCTTVDYLPDTNTLFPWAVRAADKFKDETLGGFGVLYYAGDER